MTLLYSTYYDELRILIDRLMLVISCTVMYFLRRRCRLLLLIICCAVIEVGKPAPSTMKAVVIESFGGPLVLDYRENVTVPSYLDNEMLVRVKAAGVIPIDIYIRSGSCDILPKLPAILGKEIAGFVQEVGDKIVKFKKGDRVYCGIHNGGYAQYAVAKESDCYKLSEELSYSQGASLYMSYFCLYKAFVIRGDVNQGNLVFINGAGGAFGAAAVQIAKELGARVIAAVATESSEKLMREVGADYVVSAMDSDCLKKALKWSNKRGYDLILELMPTLNLKHDRQFITEFGKIIVMGHRVPQALYGKGVFAVSYLKLTEEEKKAAAEFLKEHIEMGCIRPVIAKEYNLSLVRKAHKQIAYNNTEKDKIVLIVD